jgi:hypothetical protein
MVKESIVVGKAYVNERARVLREVVEELDEGRVKFNAFDLQSGRLLPSRHRTCDRRDMAAWAEREAQPDETARAHPFERPPWSGSGRPDGDRPVSMETARAALETASAPHAFPQLK